MPVAGVGSFSHSWTLGSFRSMSMSSAYRLQNFCLGWALMMLMGQTRGLLTPDEGHLRAETELAAGLSDAVLGAGEHPTEHVGDVVVLHALAVVLDGDAEEGLLCVAPTIAGAALSALLAPLPDAASAAFAS